jgi:hypothetical protein
MFSADIHGDVPSDRKYLAVKLLGKETPDEEFLGRLAAQETEVITLAEGLNRKPKHPRQATGLYFRVESIDWVDTNNAMVDMVVDNGWSGAGYCLELRKTKAGWSCVGIERTLWID